MKNFILLMMLCITRIAFAQDMDPDQINGSYIAKYEEKGGMKPTPERKITMALQNDQVILSVILCGSCFPATFTHDEPLSQGFGKAVFSNKSYGIYMIEYNDKGFAVVVPSRDGSKTFESVNLYTRSRHDYDTITQEKLKKFSKKLLDLI